MIASKLVGLIRKTHFWKSSADMLHTMHAIISRSAIRKGTYLINLGYISIETCRWEVPIHVDAAIGGFVASFLYPKLVWDFRLPLVKSINVSGHKYGLVYPGIGWAIWRSKEDLPEELIFHTTVLGADQPTFTLNFSKGANQIIGQYYNLLRLGFEGYKNIIENCQKNMMFLREGLEKSGEFKIISKDNGVPLVAFSLKYSGWYDEFDVSKNLRQFGWIVPAYNMPPKADKVKVLRVVVREDFSRTLAERLANDIKTVLREVRSFTSEQQMLATKIEGPNKKIPGVC